MKIFLLVALLLAQGANAKDLQNFNADILGKNVNDSFKLLLEAKPGTIEPTSIQVDLKNGKYDAATIRYPESVTVEDARESLNLLYKRFEMPNQIVKDKFGLWRNLDQKCAIQLSKDEEGNVQIIFLAFRPANEEFWKDVFKAQQMSERKAIEKKKSLKAPKYSK